MAWRGAEAAPKRSALALAIAVVMLFPTAILAKGASRPSSTTKKSVMNVIDGCWRRDPNWRHHRQQLARCSVGYAGKMTNNIGPNVTRYKVTDDGDDGLDPRPGTLRYGATRIEGKVWITFHKDMQIKLEKPLLVSSFTAIDGRGANVHIAGGACLVLLGVTDVIIHGLRIHNCETHEAEEVMGPEGNVVRIDYPDGDAISVIQSRKVWIDHNTLYECADGLIDVTHGSTDVTVSNNWFRNHDMVMLLGHHDDYVEDRNMKVTVAFNYFGPDCDQRMPRVRHGFAHVVNNLYQGWGLYAIGGSTKPSIKSEGNIFIAPNTDLKEITRRIIGNGPRGWKFASTKDLFENGATFTQTGDALVDVDPRYSRLQAFRVEKAASVRLLTWSAGVLRCRKRSHSKC
ncbi:pectate lyase 1-like [Rhododendron vialii]|uniref:pectate lyase 1-like n=1 Tax=Rhododendron vialii TaxID=182163 RepID=UPI00265E44FC|nr:pectate lyase 1-like [Rhododendron vialii]